MLLRLLEVYMLLPLDVAAVILFTTITSVRSKFVSKTLGLLRLLGLEASSQARPGC
jgi:hypothetical protein